MHDSSNVVKGDTPRLPVTPAERIAYDQVTDHGVSFAASFPNIWVDGNLIIGAVVSEITPIAQRIALENVKPNTIARRRFWFAWADGLLFVVLLVIASINKASSALVVLLVLMAVWWVWLVASWRVALAKPREEQEKWLTSVGVVAALVKINERQDAARSYDPEVVRGSAEFAPAGPAPFPQPYGVSHEGAEALVAEWVRYLGEADAEITRFTGDGGIDVQSMHYIIQVKNYSGSVGVAEVRELGGVAAVDGRKPLFFTSGSYAAGAVDFAERSGIALFVYDAHLGTLVGANGAAERALVRGL